MQLTVGQISVASVAQRIMLIAILVSKGCAFRRNRKLLKIVNFLSVMSGW